MSSSAWPSDHDHMAVCMRLPSGPGAVVSLTSLWFGHVQLDFAPMMSSAYVGATFLGAPTGRA